MHSKSIGCPQIFPLSAPVLYWLSHLTCIWRVKAKNERKTLIYTQPNKSRYNQQFFAIFRRILRTYLRPIYCSLTTSKHQTLWISPSFFCPTYHDEIANKCNNVQKTTIQDSSATLGENSWSVKYQQLQSRKPKCCIGQRKITSHFMACQPRRSGLVS